MKYSKKLFFPMLLFVSILFLSLPVKASPTASVLIDGQSLPFETSPIIVNNRLMVPMRSIFTSLGFALEWDQEKKAVTAVCGNETLWMQIGNYNAYKNNSLLYLDTPLQLQDNYTMIPLRFVAEVTGATVSWDNEKRIATIDTKSEKKSTPADCVVMIVAAPTGQQGSGVILSEDGLIATNFHVLENSKTLSIIFNDSSVYGGDIQLAGYNIDLDLAVIRITKKGLSPVKLADSDTISIGDAITAISSPLGIKNTQTQGTILDDQHQILSFNASTNYGSSGGALFNEKEELTGIIYSRQDNGKGFAIPSNSLKNLDMSASIALSDISQVDTSLRKLQTKDISVSYEANKAHLYWNNIYGSDGYELFSSKTADGPFEPVKNKVTNSTIWNWGYPFCFTITSKEPFHAYYKIAPTKNGKTGPQSDAIEIIIKAE